MPYYASGDYYGRGDPGMWGALWAGAKGLAKRVTTMGGFGKGGGTVADLNTAVVQSGMPTGPGSTLQIAKALAGAAVGAGVAGLAAKGIGSMFGGHRAGGGRTYRRMNAGNVKALRRSMRRVESFAKLAHATINFTKTTRLKKRGKGHR